MSTQNEQKPGTERGTVDAVEHSGSAGKKTYPGQPFASNPISTAVSLGTLYENSFQNIYFQKEPDSEVVKANIAAYEKVSALQHQENLRYAEMQEKQNDHQYEYYSKRDARNFTLNSGIMVFLALMVAFGCFLLYEGQTIEAASLIAGGIGAIVGYFAGFGAGRSQ